jgi:hypothetical protein
MLLFHSFIILIDNLEKIKEEEMNCWVSRTEMKYEEKL